MRNSLPLLRARRGFTLIEILVVIGIVLLLAGLLFPVFSRVREVGRRTSCSSNLRQLGMGFQQYQNDNNGRFPGPANFQAWANGGAWVTGGQGGIKANLATGLASSAAPFDYTAPYEAYPDQGAIYPYVKSTSVYMCPSGEDVDKKHLSYSMNCALGFMGNARIKEPSKIILLVDEGKSLNDGYFYAVKGGGSTDTLTQKHLGGGNLLFTDGHVKFFPFDAFPLDDSAAGQENKAARTGDVRFHDLAFGPQGSFFKVSNPPAATDICGVSLVPGP